MTKKDLDNYEAKLIDLGRKKLRNTGKLFYHCGRVFLIKYDKGTWDDWYFILDTGLHAYRDGQQCYFDFVEDLIDFYNPETMEIEYDFDRIEYLVGDEIYDSDDDYIITPFGVIFNDYLAHEDDNGQCSDYDYDDYAPEHLTLITTPEFDQAWNLIEPEIEKFMEKLEQQYKEEGNFDLIYRVQKIDLCLNPNEYNFNEEPRLKDKLHVSIGDNTYTWSPRIYECYE